MCGNERESIKTRGNEEKPEREPDKEGSGHLGAFESYCEFIIFASLQWVSVAVGCLNPPLHTDTENFRSKRKVIETQDEPAIGEN